MKVPFGLHKDTNRYIGINEAENGLRCGCICPECKMELKARQGEENEHHFAHHNAAEVECNYSYWVSVRSMVKQMIEEGYLAIDSKKLHILNSVPWHKDYVYIKKVTSDPRVKDRQLDNKMNTSFGAIYIHLITDAEDRGSIPMHRSNQRKNNTFSEYLICEINIQGVRKCNNKTSQSFLEKILKEKGKHKDWFTTHSSYLKYLEKKKYREKREKLAETKTVISNSKPKIIYGDSTKEILSNEDPLKKKMLGFYHHMHSSYSYEDKLSISLKTIYTGKNLWYVSCCNEFFCISHQWEFIIYEVIGNEIIRLGASPTYDDLELTIRELIDDRNNAF